ncbi:MAG: phosphate/phosphite/phosphonate ABC transporter substrate-binding protein [Dissulfurispiraceae bacterium]|jgi:phosphonate transport system substrate-binding protein
MKKRNHLSWSLSIVLISVLTAIIFGCLELVHNNYALAVESYTFGVVPQFEQRKLYAVWKPVIDELERRTGLAFKLVTTLKIQDFEKEFLNGNFDFVYMNPYFMLVGSMSQKYIPLVRDKSPLRGILVVPKDSPIKNLSELNGKVVAFPSPNAIGASMLIRADLERMYHVTVKPLYVKTHSSVYLHVVKGLAAAGGGVEKTLGEQEQEIRDSLRILYTTREIPSHPVAAHPRVAKIDREKVRRALLDMGLIPEGRKLLSRIPIKEIMPARAGDYAAMSTWGLDDYWTPYWSEE